MPTDSEIELYRQHRTSQDKYTYFLLAAAGASIAFAVTQTKEAKLGYDQIPIGIAAILWGLSFYFGCKAIDRIHSILYANFTTLRIESGREPSVGTHPQKMAIALDVGREHLERANSDSIFYSRAQFNTLILGAASFLVWHVIEMWIRSYPGSLAPE